MNDLFEQPFTWGNIGHFLAALPCKEQVRFALFCTTQIKHLIKEKKSLKALEVVKLFLEGKATHEECHVAQSAVYKVYDADDTDDAVYHMARAASYTASYAYAAGAAAYTARAAAYTADAAACTAHYAARVLPEEQTKEEQMDFLRDLLLKNLSEEDKECWLLMASI